MDKKKLLYKYMRTFKPYFDNKTNSLRKDAPPEAREAYQKFQVLLEDFDPADDYQFPPNLPEEEARKRYK